MKNGFYLMEENPDRVLQSSPTDDGLGRCQEKNVSVKIVLNKNDRIRRNPEKSLNLKNVFINK